MGDHKSNDATSEGVITVESVLSEVPIELDAAVEPEPFVDAKEELLIEAKEETSWWSYLKKQTDTITTQYKKEVQDIVDQAKQDASLLQSTFNTLSIDISSQLAPQLTSLQTQLQTTLNTAIDSTAVQSLKDLTAKADSFLDGVESTLETYESYIGTVGKELIGALVHEGVQEEPLIQSILQIQAIMATFTEDPLEEDWPAYLELFTLTSRTAEIERMLRSPRIERWFASAEDRRLFWARYFYKHDAILENIERRKRVLESVEILGKKTEEDLTWGDEEEVVVAPVVKVVEMETMEEIDSTVEDSVKIEADSLPEEPTTKADGTSEDWDEWE